MSPFKRQIVNPFLQNSPYVTSPFLSEVSRKDTGAKISTSNEGDQDYRGTKMEVERFKNKKLVETSGEEVINHTCIVVSKAQNKSDKAAETVKMKDVHENKGKQSLDILSNEGFRKIDVNDVERQIIARKETDIEKPPHSLSDFRSNCFLNEGSDLQSKQAELDCSKGHYAQNSYSGNHTTRSIGTDEGQRQRYTPSFCSSCSCDDSVTVQSRCSVCDGCSSSTCNSSYSSTEHMHSSGDCAENYFHPLEMSETKIENLLESHLSFDDSGLLKQLVEDVDDSKVKENPNVRLQNSFSFLVKLFAVFVQTRNLNFLSQKVLFL